jgi:hypothetical protein
VRRGRGRRFGMGLGDVPGDGQGVGEGGCGGEESDDGIERCGRLDDLILVAVLTR